MRGQARSTILPKVAWASYKFSGIMALWDLLLAPVLRFLCYSVDVPLSKVSRGQHNQANRAVHSMGLTNLYFSAVDAVVDDELVAVLAMSSDERRLRTVWTGAKSSRADASTTWASKYQGCWTCEVMPTLVKGVQERILPLAAWPRICSGFRGV